MFPFRLWLWLLIRASLAYRLRIKFIFLSQLFRLLFYVGMAARMAEVAPHPMNMFPAIGRRKGIDINTSFVIGSACYAELSPVVDLTLRSVFADDPKWRSVPPVMICAARSALACDLDRGPRTVPRAIVPSAILQPAPFAPCTNLQPSDKPPSPTSSEPNAKTEPKIDHRRIEHQQTKAAKEASKA